MFESLSFGAMLLIEATLLIEALIESGVLVYVVASAIAATGLFVTTSQANAEAPNTFFDAQEAVAGADDRVQVIGSPDLIKPLDFHFSPNLTFAENLHIVPVQYHFLAQKPAATAQEELPTIPAPANYGAVPANPTPPQADAPAAGPPPSAAPPMTEFEKELKKTEEETEKKEAASPSFRIWRRAFSSPRTTAT